ncbi:hypothetical protein TELCIR_12555 [Teladorsagia circumcincta]|uniref:Uncharacterized protein n=1 Tax=Teladorsagia circumcincta TaxID=45464 RepID=A0A2G9U6G8_TELCI|nr:hypothetical protein TELCIR_12555 [Teladorsagia circumcincta]
MPPNTGQEQSYLTASQMARKADLPRMPHLNGSREELRTSGGNRTCPGRRSAKIPRLSTRTSLQTTDESKPLLAIYGSKKSIPVYTANLLQRWSLIMMNYNFTIEYRTTSNFGQADALSHLIAD